MVIFLVFATLTMVALGTSLRGVPGLWIAMAGMLVGNVAQYGWLAWRAKGMTAPAG
jgi:hypothetical protein